VTPESDNQLEIRREGFENIADSANVFQMMRQVQLGTVATPNTGNDRP